MPRESVTFEMTPIGVVTGGRADARDDQWGPVEATIVLDGDLLGPDATAGIGDFSHIEVVFVFDRVADDEITRGARHPRGNLGWPSVGILAQRAKGRPNRIGVTVCELLSVETGALHVRGLDAVDGTPVLDVKPYIAAFGPRGPVRQPPWAEDLMLHYW